VKRTGKILKWLLAILLVAAIGGIVFSPYGKKDGFEYRLIKTTIEIDAPADSVFRWLGNSGNAKQWSVFVDHISPLNSDSFPDGVVNSRRRCYCKPDETGIVWDELITQVQPGKLRELTIYNMHGFPMKAEDLATQQIYESADGGKHCRLTFTLFYLHHDPSLFESFKTYIAAYKVSSIYKENLSNIKRLTEEKFGSR
jgi:hypothetical protein